MANKEDRKDFTFYINNDNIYKTHKQDVDMCEDFVKAFKKAGFKAKYVGSGSDVHSHPNKHGCTGKNDIWTIVVGGDDIGMYRDLTREYFKKRLGKAKICLIRVFHTYNGRGISKKAKNINGLKKAHDDNYSKGSVALKGNLADFLTKNGYSWFEGSPKTIVNQIEEGKIEGVGLVGLTSNSTSSSSSKTISWEETFTHGFNDQNPFKGYLEIQYTVDFPYGHPSNPKVKTINVDFSLQAPEAVDANIIIGDGLSKHYIPPSFNNTIPSWVNDTIRENSFNLLEHVRDAENDFSTTSTKLYYLHKVSFKAEFKDNWHEFSSHDYNTGKETTTNVNVLYDKKFDMSCYKMNLYSLGFYKGDIVTAKNMNSSGKKLNSVVEEVLKDSNFYSKMNYGLFRFNDRIDFNEIKAGTTPPVFDFYDNEHWDKNKTNHIVDGNVIDVSNISYTPINDTLNNSIFIFKGRYDILKEDEALKFYYQRYCDLDKVLKYGEQTILNSDTSNTNSNTEAYVNAQKYFINNYDERRSYTIKVVGIPPVNINDYVCTHMDNPNLNSGDSGLRVASIEYDFDPKNRPVIQTTLGLGKPDKKFVIEDKRKLTQTKYKELDIGKNIGYGTILDNDNDLSNELVEDSLTGGEQ